MARTRGNAGDPLAADRSNLTWVMPAQGGRTPCRDSAVRRLPFQEGTMTRRVVLVGVGLAVAGFIYFFPRLTGMPIPNSFAEQYVWFESWK